MVWKFRQKFSEADVAKSQILPSDTYMYVGVSGGKKCTYPPVRKSTY